MCGIAGIARLGDGRLEGNVPALVEKMNAAQARRGPDDRGVAEIGRVVFGTVRLSILDLSDAGHMPMADDEGRWWITYNGEVYNFAEIRAELEQLGHRFRSRTDTEVVLRAFREWGEECLDRFVGMFAFAVYDKKDDRLTLVRDRYGIKPLYFREEGGAFLFASEMKALLAVTGRPAVDKRSLIEWFLYRNVESFSSDTLLEGVRALLPGHLLTIERGGAPAVRRYYSPADRVDEAAYERLRRAGHDAVAAEFEEVLGKCVTERLVSDVPVGTLCSGGLDSSLVTALAAGARKDVTAFNVSVAGHPDLDEGPYAEEVARHLGIDLVTHSLTAKEYRRTLPSVIAMCDSPLSHPNTVAYHMICRVAREKGTIVLLSGEGADELFGGYAWRYRRDRNLLRAVRWFRRLPRRVRRGVHFRSYGAAGMPATHLHFDSLLPPTVHVIDRYGRSRWKERCESAYRFVPGADDREILGAMLADLNDFLTPLLRRLDRMSMGASVECRVPFLDHRLVHRSIHLPLDYRLGARGDKWIVRRIARTHLPARIGERKKLGFPLPVVDYLRPFAHPDFFRGGFCEEAIGIDGAARAETLASWTENVFAFFNLVALEIWGRMVLMGESVDEVGERIARLEADQPE